MANLLLIQESDDRGVARTVNGREGHRTFKQYWDATPTTKEIEQATGMPVIGDPHPDFAEMKVYKIGEADNKDLRIYFVPVYYSSTKDTQSHTDEDTPLDDPWEVSITTESREKVIERTTIDTSSLTSAPFLGVAEDTPIETAAFERFDPPITEDESIVVVTLSKNKAPDDVDVHDVSTYVNTINSAETTIVGFVADKWQAKMMAIDIQGPYTDRGVTYYKQTYKIGLREDWHHRVANMGFMCLNSKDEQVTATGEGGNPFKKPVALDADGHYHPETPECEVFFIFATLTEKAWAGLGLPATLPV